VSPDPGAAAWRELAAELGTIAERHVRHVFEWLDHCLETGESRGEVATVLALADLANGRPLSTVIGGLLDSADLWMPCPGEDDPSCRCGFCAFGRSAAALAAAERVSVR